MVSKEEELRVLEFSKIYTERLTKVSGYKDELTELQTKIRKELLELEEYKLSEGKFLEDLKVKYDSTPEVIVQLLQKIIMANG
tara:strand:- start:7 stop:255 length:249 start_codon:yes stop_codon:yes gene_type:complete